MPRYTFGGLFEHVGVAEDPNNLGTDGKAALRLDPDVTVPLYLDRARTQLADDFMLFDEVTGNYSSPAAEITVNADAQLPDFQGPDGVFVLWGPFGAMLRAWDYHPEGGGGDGSATWDTLSGKPQVIAAGATENDAQIALGLTQIGRQLGTAASMAAARTAIQAAAAGGVVNLTTDQIKEGLLTLLTGLVLPDGATIQLPAGALPAGVINDFGGAIDGILNGISVPKIIEYTGNDLPPDPGPGYWLAVKTDTPLGVSEINFVHGGGTGSDAADGSYPVTLSRAFAADSIGVAFVALGGPGTQPASSITGGFASWARAVAPDGTPLVASFGNGNAAFAVFVSSGAASGTALTVDGPSAATGMVATFIELIGLKVKQGVVSGSMASSSPAVTMPGVLAENPVIGAVCQNTYSALEVGTGFTALGGLELMPQAPPTVSILSEYRLDGVGTISFANATQAQKVVAALELEPR